MTYAAERHTDPLPYNQFVLAEIQVVPHGTNPITINVDQAQSSVTLRGKELLGAVQDLTITPGAVPPNWHLRFGYPTGHILGMNPNSHLAPNGKAVTVRSSDYAGGSGPDGRTFAIGVGVQGVPTHPRRCSFDGQPCHIG